MSGTTYTLVSLPNEQQPPDQVFGKLTGSAVKAYADIFKVEVPALQVGTLDSLMHLSDDLVRIDMLVENMVRKIEKQYIEVAGEASETLKVAGVSPGQYVRMFEWDYSKFAVRQRLPALVALIQGSVGKIEEEHRNLSMVFAEKNQAMQALKRKKGNNLATVELSEVLSSEQLRGVMMVDTENLVTLAVAMGKTQEKDWLEGYESIGSEIASLGSPDWSNPSVANSLGTQDGQFGPGFSSRGVVKGSPVVPGSTQKVLEEGEQVLYTVTVLRGQYQAGFHDGEQFQAGMSTDYVAEFKRKCKEKRFTARDFVFNPERSGENQRMEEQLKTEVQQLHAGMIRWCRAHFGEAFSAWMHVKLVKSYVESVMRYGLPVDFSAFVLATKKGQEAKVKDALSSLYSHVSQLSSGPITAGGGEDDGDKDDEDTPYVSDKFSIVATK
ncbi:unnamed protein product [Ectocarpus sp. CCAP 1310/34]|nr:unnamed protein product [Ectocarpus sp. CCAP 1310/34]